VADAVMLAVSERLAPRFVARPGLRQQLLEVQGMNLERYATLRVYWNPSAGVCKVSTVTASCIGSTAVPISCGRSCPGEVAGVAGGANAGTGTPVQPVADGSTRL
jgi:hypothetical protein